MSSSLIIQLFLAFFMIACVSVYSFFNLSSKSIDFLNIPREEQLYFSCLIINEITYILAIIYGVLLCFWSTLTSCWRENTTSSNSFSCSTACFFIIFILTNFYLFYILFIEPIPIPEYLKENGLVFLSLIGAIILEGIVFSFFRNCINCKSKKRKLLKYQDKDVSNDEIV